MRLMQLGYLIALASLVFAAKLVVTPTRGVALAAEPHEETVRQVTIDNFSFGPADLTVPVGTKVTWTNKDDVPHTVTSTNKVFGSPVLDTDQQFSFTFKQAGTFEYFCELHPKMTAKVTVK